MVGVKAQESDSLLRDGLYPNGMKHVLVRAKEKHSDTYKWTSGMATGETGKHGETFEVRTDSPLVEADKAMYHKEDIKNPDNHTVSRLNS